MKKNHFIIAFVIGISFFLSNAYGQILTQATDFTLADCDGNQHTLFTALDNGEVVALEFVMGCLPCVNGRKALDKMEKQFAVSNPGKFHVYTFGYSSNIDCGGIQKWMTDNKFTGTSFGGDDTVISSYNADGGMPTIVVVGGADHKVLYWKKGFAVKDSASIKSAVNKGLGIASVASANNNESITIFPNPSNGTASLKVDCLRDGVRNVTIYNANGAIELSVFNGTLAKGEHSIPFSTDRLSNGTYFVRVTTEGKTTVTSLTVVH